MLYFAQSRRASAVPSRPGDPDDNMPNSRKILIVDDDTDLREALVEQLALHEEFEAIAVDTGTKGVQAAKAGQIDLVIMDVGLPDVDGREAVRILRKNGFKAPIIMLTGHDTDLRHHPRPGIRRQRLRHQAVPLRGAAGAHPRAASPARGERGRGVHHRALHVPAELQALAQPQGQQGAADRKETAILRYLYRAGQQPVSRETLLQEVWGYNSGVTTHTLETHIYRLRQKVEKDAATPAILVTEAGGYKLVP